MKLKFLYTLFATVCGAFLLLNNSSGAGAVQNQDRTGSPLSSATCQACHSANAFSPTISLEILENDAPITAYTPGQTYVMRVSAGFTGSPQAFGFQAVALNGSNNQQAGNFQNPPSGTQITNLNGRQYPEHSQRSQSNTFEMEWVAPEAGTGEVRFHSSIVAANNAGGSTGDGAASLGSPVTLSEGAPSSRTNANNLDAAISVFPNPASHNATLRLTDARSGQYEISLISAHGQHLSTQQLQAEGAATTELYLANHPAGVYFVRISDGQRTAVRRLVKR